MPGHLFVRDNLAEFVAASGSEIGAHSYGDPAIRWWGEAARLRMGRYCSIADGVTIFIGGNHRPDWISTYPFNSLPGWPAAEGLPGHPATRGDVVIGHDVWIGAEAVVLSGVTIGDGAVVGAGAVVSRSVEPYAIVAGNPARLVRHRFRPPVVAALQALAWWDRPDEEVNRLAPFLMSADLPGLFAACGAAWPVEATRPS